MSGSTLVRWGDNPILTRADIPDVSPTACDVSSVFNPGAVARGNRTLLALRVQTRGRETLWMLADSPDGVAFSVRPTLVELPTRAGNEPIHHAYDPRLTRIGDEIFVTFSADTDDGCHVGVGWLHDDGRFEVLGISTERDSRNAVLFPERVGGRYLRLERPNEVRQAGGPPTGERIFLAESDDLVDWRLTEPVMDGRPRYWDEWIGSGPPPVRVREGWLHVYHGVATHFASANIYQAGVCLLDADDPSKVLARGRNNILEPREPYELIGQVPNVVFPSGMIVDQVDAEGYALPDSPVRIYYGAADTCVGLARTSVDRLLAAARVT